MGTNGGVCWYHQRTLESEIDTQRLLVTTLAKHMAAEDDDQHGRFGAVNPDHFYFTGQLSDGLSIMVTPVPTIEGDPDYRVYVVPSDGASLTGWACALRTLDCWDQVNRGLREYPQIGRRWTDHE